MATAEHVKSVLMEESPTLYDPVTKAAVTCYLGEGYPNEEDVPGIALLLVEPEALLDALSRGDVEYPDELFAGGQGPLDVVSEEIEGYGGYLTYGTDSFDEFIDTMAVSFGEPGRWLTVPGDDKEKINSLINELTYITGMDWSSPFVSDLMGKGEPVQGGINSVVQGICLFSPARGVFIGYEESEYIPGTYDLAVHEVSGRELAERLSSSADYGWAYDVALECAHNSVYLPIQGHEEELRQLAGGIHAEQNRWIPYEGLGFEEVQDNLSWPQILSLPQIEDTLQARKRFGEACARSRHMEEVRDVLTSLSDHLSSVDDFIHALDADIAIDAVIADAHRAALDAGETPEQAANSIATDILISLVAATTPDVDGKTLLDEQECVPLTTLTEIAVSKENDFHEAR